jgi:ankyrin repeat protein
MDVLREGPLHIAAQAGDAQKVARLVAEGAVVDAGNYRRYTPLHLAAGIAASEVVAVLLAAGADAAALSTFKTTPLHQAARGGARATVDARVEVIDRLLAAGCSLDAVDSTGRTALWYAAATGTAPWPAEQQAARYHVLLHLLDRGADPGIQARGTQGRPIDAARGLHQPRKYRIEWADGVALLDSHGRAR